MLAPLVDGLCDSQPGHMKSKCFQGKIQLDAWWPNFPNIGNGIIFPEYVIFHIVIFPDVIFHIVIFPDGWCNIPHCNILIAIFPFAIASISFPFDRWPQMSLLLFKGLATPVTQWLHFQYEERQPNPPKMKSLTHDNFYLLISMPIFSNRNGKNVSWATRSQIISNASTSTSTCPNCISNNDITFKKPKILWMAHMGPILKAAVTTATMGKLFLWRFSQQTRKIG